MIFGVRERENNQDRSDKICICGGHNLNNVKSNLHHNATRRRLNIKKQRKFKFLMLRGLDK